MSRFQTDSLPFAAFLACTNKLDFIGCEPNANGRVSFVFADPDKKGNQLWLEYETGAVAPIVAFYNAIRALRQVMDDATGKQRKERRYYEHRLDGRAARTFAA